MKLFWQTNWCNFHTQVTLRSLMMEDLQQLDTSAQHRFLMKSDTLPLQSPDGPAPYGMHLHPGHHPHMHFMKEHHVPEFISTSCPERFPHQPVCFTSSSLPDKLKMEKPFFKAAQKPVPRRHLESEFVTVFIQAASFHVLIFVYAYIESLQ